MNKEKLQQLAAEGLLMPAGLAAIETAQQNGSFGLLDEADALVVPPNLAQALQASLAAEAYFAGLSRPDTRQRRLAEIVALAAQRQKPAQFGGRKTTGRASG